MSREDVNAELAALTSRFRERLNSDVKTMDMHEAFPETFEPGTFWYFRPASGTDADKILRHLNTGDLFRAQVEAILHRTYNENGKKKFAHAHLEQLRKMDPLDVGIIADRLGAFDDIAPDIGELEKNSEATPKPKASSTLRSA